MKTLPTVNKQGTASGSNLKTKKNGNEKRKAQTSSSPASTSTNSGKSTSRDSRSYIGYGTDQLAAIVEQTTGEKLTEEVATAFVEDINYKLRFVISDALTKARLSGRRGITTDDINDTFQCLAIDKIYGAPNTPTWHVISEPSGQNIHYLEDPVVNLFDLAELAMTYIEPNDSVVTRKYLPQTMNNSLKSYYKAMCKAVVEEDKELRAIALNDIRNNCSIGPIIGWFYNFSYMLLRKDVTYEGLTIHALEFIECLEVNPVSGLVVSERQLKLLASLLFQRLLNANGNGTLITPICRLLTLLCRRIVLRKMILKKMVTKYVKLKRFFAYPMICLANEFGIDGVMVVIVPNLKHILHIVRLTKDPGFINEALRAYYILCGAGTYIKNICNQFYDIFGDGILPYWQNKSYVSAEVPLEYDWHNVKRELYKSMRKVLPAPQYKQKKITVDDAFPVNEEGMIEGVEQNRPKIRQRDKMQRIHPTNFTPTRNEPYVIIGKRTLLANVLRNKIKKPKCTYHTMMFHNL